MERGISASVITEAEEKEMSDALGPLIRSSRIVRRGVGKWRRSGQ